MTWTMQKPTVPGWYWWIDDSQPHNTMLPGVVWVDHSLVVHALTRKIHGVHAHVLGGEWAGPIPMPEEP